MTLITAAVTQPHSLEAERTVLGALLLDPDAMFTVRPVLTDADFYDSVHRAIYAACCRLHDERRPLDFVTVGDALAAEPSVSQIGGSAFLAELAASIPTASHVEQYARIVRDKADRRRLIGLASKFSAWGYDNERTYAELIDDVHQQVLGLNHAGDDRRTELLADVSSRRYDQISDLQQGGVGDSHRRVRSGFSGIDYYFNGFPAGSLVIVAARPGMGKTCLLMDMTRQAAQDGKRVLFFSLEMSREEMSDRLLAGNSGVSMWDMQKGNIDDEQLLAIGRSIDDIKQLPIYIDDDPDATLSNLRSKALRHQLEHGLDLVVVDYLQLIEPPFGRQKENRVQEISLISRGLKKLAKELDAPVIAASQLSRAVENRPKCIPQLADLRESGSIEQDADSVLMLYREGEYESDCESPDLTNIFIRKNRNGPLGVADLMFDRGATRFRTLHLEKAAA